MTDLLPGFPGVYGTGGEGRRRGRRGRRVAGRHGDRHEVQILQTIKKCIISTGNSSINKLYIFLDK
jgi:hypothetical protein